MSKNDNSNKITNLLKMKELGIPNISDEEKFLKHFNLNDSDNILDRVIYDRNTFKQGEFVFKNVSSESDSDYDPKTETDSFTVTINGELEYKDMFFDFSYYLESDSPRLEYAELAEDGYEFSMNIEKTIKNIENIKRMKELDIPNIRTEEELCEFLGVDNINILENLNKENLSERALPHGLKIKSSEFEKTMFEDPYQDELMHTNHNIVIKSGELEFEFKYQKFAKGYVESHSFNMLKENSIENVEEKQSLNKKNKRRMKI